MAERIAPADPAVDDLRRKARRRLVGAIVLALAAAVILPMLLEKEPRPLGEDVAVRIPPVDEGKFVNRLSPSAPPGAPADATRPAVSAPATGDAAPSGSAETVPAPAGKPENAAKAEPTAPSKTEPPRPESPSKPEPSGKSETAAKPDASRGEPKTEARVETKPAIRGEAKPAAGEVGAGKAKPGESFVVQLAAFSDDKGANALASKLKRNGYPAFTEPIQTSRGTLYRVRVGSYATREAAGDARNKLKGDGYAGIVAPAH